MKGMVVMFLLLSVLIGNGLSQPPDANYDENKVPDYTLPPALTTLDGKPVRSSAEWFEIRRPEILKLFETEVYGRAPESLPSVSYEVLSGPEGVLGGKGTRQEVRIHFSKSGKKLWMDLLIYLPRGGNRVPVFVGLNFNGNHSVQPDPEIRLSTAWMRGPDASGNENHRATESARGSRAHRWPVEMMLDRGYGLATAYYGDIDPDFHDGFQNGIHSLFYTGDQSSPAADEWGSIAAWAWGLSRALDYLMTESRVDRKRIAVIGHSRLGKTALWAGALDQRFALVVSNNSGCGGAALSRRRFGETVARINTVFPHWFSGNFKRYNGAEDSLPVDQH
jgi:hypothetical protein